VLPGARAGGSAAQDVDADATSGEENGTSGLVVLIGRAAPVLLLALVKVLRAVNASWIIAALPQRVPVTCQGSRAARCAPRGVEEQ
jgi:hypothetical protein